MAVEQDIGAGGMADVPVEDQSRVIELAPAFPEVPGIMELPDGGALVGELPEDEVSMADVPFDANLAEFMEERDLGSIASDIVGLIDDDLSSREDWEETYREGLDYLGMKYEDRSEPFEGSSGIVHPLLAEAATQFQAQAYRELLPAGGPVRTQVLGAQTLELVKQAERVKEFMNYQITYEMDEYDPEMDQMLMYLPLSGSTFKKVYFDPLKGRPVSKFIQAEDVIVPYTTTDLFSTPRITHRIPMESNDILKLQLSGFYRDVDLPSSAYPDYDMSGVKDAIDDAEGIHPGSASSELTVYEVHVDLDLPGFEDVDPETGEETGLKLPYIVTILKDTNKVLSIRRNYRADDPKRAKRQHFVHYKFLPGLGFYGFGLTHTIGGLAKGSTSLLRQLIDAGTLSNLPAGFKAKGARIDDSSEALQPGEFRDIDIVNGSIRDALMPLPFKEPSPTLYNLLGSLVEAGRRFASMADQQLGDMASGEAPVGTTMAIMERGTKVMSSIHKRLHYSQKIEFKLLARLFAENMEPYPYAVDGAPPDIKPQDFDGRIDVLPVSDPNIFSMSQRIALAQTQLQLVQSNPQIHGPNGMYFAYRKMYEALGVTNVDQILPPPPQPQPMNPAKENQVAMMGQPPQAFPGQDHRAHIQAHLAIMSTPAMQINPNAIIMLQGHIQEHIGLLAEEQAQQEIMSQIPPMPVQNQMMQQQIMMQMKPQIDARAAQLVAQIAEEFAITVEPPQQQDPLVMIRQQELQIKAMENQRKADEFAREMEFDRERERNKILLGQQRLDQQEEATAERTRVAEERILAQKQIAALNANVNRGRQ